jgi:hypothetical protein
MSLRAVSVRINNQNSPKIRDISYDNNINVKVSTQQTYKVSSFKYEITGVKYLKDLLDVSALNPADKDSLIFNVLTGKFESKPITTTDIVITNLDAGTF